MIQKKIYQGKADLHIHSRYSKDAVSSLSAILKRAKKAGLDLIAITDHDTVAGAKEAKKMAPEFGLEVIVGEEIKTKEGDVIALFIDDSIPSGKGLKETIKEIRQQEGLIIIPHPANWFLGGVHYRALFKFFRQIDGIELFNGSWAGKIRKKESEKLNDLIFNLAKVGGSDAHLARQVGCAYTFFPGKTSDDLYMAIKNKLTTTGGEGWNYKDRLFWLINTPRIFYRSPKTLKDGTKRIIKKILIG